MEEEGDLGRNVDGGITFAAFFVGVMMFVAGVRNHLHNRRTRTKKTP